MKQVKAGDTIVFDSVSRMSGNAAEGFTAYEELFKNVKFKNALLSTKGSKLTHSIGRTNPKETVLTRSEFCGRLTKLRDVGWLSEKNNPNKPLF